MAGISFDDIMMRRAKVMAERGIKPSTMEEGKKGPPVGAIQRRMQPPQDLPPDPTMQNQALGGLLPQEAPNPQMYLRKLPKEVAALAVQYGRI